MGNEMTRSSGNVEIRMEVELQRNDYQSVLNLNKYISVKDL